MTLSKSYPHRPLTCAFYLIFVILLSACQPQAIPTQGTPTSEVIPTELRSATATEPPPSLWISDAVPEKLRDSLSIGTTVIATNPEDATINFDVLKPIDSMPPTSRWVYALAAPFPTLVDDADGEMLRNAWLGTAEGEFEEATIWVTQSTLLSFSAQWGEPDSTVVKTAQADELSAKAWESQPAFAILPFEDLNPTWKVISLNGSSPLQHELDLSVYPLVVPFGLKGNAAGRFQSLVGENWAAKQNWDPEKLTTLILTGTTALVRSTAERMETKGILYPAEKIRDWLRGADITHISNEVSFTPNCPPPNPEFINLQFCSAPKNIALLEDVGVDVVEMTGNHLVDYDRSALEYTLTAYKEMGWKFYGSGRNKEEALQPVFFTDHGNELAILGCNIPGPEYSWAGEDQIGVGQCDMEMLRKQVEDLRAEGTLVVVTLQHNESYAPTPMPWVAEDFLALADAGASVVSGSQAHFPQTFTVTKEHFVHYGLGNLFFDQMDYPVPGTRREFIDRHVFYNGEYIGVQLLTAMLEDYAQPRPMTPDERQEFLAEYFRLSSW